jgi:hypothetical protein
VRGACEPFSRITSSRVCAKMPGSSPFNKAISSAEKASGMNRYPCSSNSAICA